MKMRLDEVPVPSANYFSLADDKDSATVRFVYSKIDEIDIYQAHRVQIGKSYKLVDCLRGENDPIDACPLCAARAVDDEGKEVPAYPVTYRALLMLYNVEADKIQVWERSAQFVRKLAAQLSAIRAKEIAGAEIVITRIGKKGDKKTDYTLMVVNQDETTKADLLAAVEVPNIDSMILEKSKEDMTAFVETGVFPKTSDGASAEEQEDGPEETPAEEEAKPQNPSEKRTFARPVEKKSTPTIKRGRRF